ncbi:MAG: FKBP-type peptidyl-prolyl cis-trans isomerase [Mycobacterium sp.]|nr:FKBP-type peptidyl-prolyl cis-trans isomerase [Mycobacterium sp.]
MTAVNLSDVYSPVALAACATAFVLTLSACSSDSETPAATTPSESTTSEVAAPPIPVTEPTSVAGGCPTAAPAEGGTPEWTLSGTEGSVAVTGSTDDAAPYVKVNAPFTVTETQVQTLQAGDGPVVADTAMVSVCYMGVNGRDGTVFDSSYEQGTPVEFPLDGVVPGFQKAIAGQTVGSKIAVAMVSADGYPDGQPGAGILPGDTLIFAIKILDASS